MKRAYRIYEKIKHKLFMCTNKQSELLPYGAELIANVVINVLLLALFLTL